MTPKEFVLKNSRLPADMTKCLPLKNCYPGLTSEDHKRMKGWFYIYGFGCGTQSKSPKKCWEYAQRLLHEKMLEILES